MKPAITTWVIAIAQKAADSSSQETVFAMLNALLKNAHSTSPTAIAQKDAHGTGQEMASATKSA